MNQTVSIQYQNYPTENGDYTFSQRMQIIWRCVFNACPRCNHKGVSSPLRFPDVCPDCGFRYERLNGFLLTALPAVYFGYTLFWLLPTFLLYTNGFLGFNNALIVGGSGALFVPFLIFNYCKMLALALYYFFLPRELYHENLQDAI